MEKAEQEKGSLELNYKGDMEEHLSEYFDSRIAVLEWHVKQRERTIERAKERIKELTPAPIGDLDVDPNWKEKVQREEELINRCENVIKELLYEPIGWLYEIKHEIMKID